MNLIKNGTRALALLICLQTFHAYAAEPAPLSPKDNVRNAILTFRENPLSPRGGAAGEFVRSFAQKDDSVIVRITQKVAPFSNDLRLGEEIRTVLLDAFVVGNVEAQLLRDEKKDHPEAGVEEVIETYQQVKKKTPTLVIPEVEKFIELKKQGKLEEYLAAP